MAGAFPIDCRTSARGIHAGPSGVYTRGMARKPNVFPYLLTVILQAGAGGVRDGYGAECRDQNCHVLNQKIEDSSLKRRMTTQLLGVYCYQGALRRARLGLPPDYAEGLCLTSPVA